jgi:hypothetical protein
LIRERSVKLVALHVQTRHFTQMTLGDFFSDAWDSTLEVDPSSVPVGQSARPHSASAQAPQTGGVGAMSASSPDPQARGGGVMPSSSQDTRWEAKTPAYRGIKDQDLLD